MDEYLDRFKFYARTKDQKKAWENLNQMIDGLNLLSRLNRQTRGRALVIEGTDLLDRVNEEFKLSPKAAESISKTI